MNKVSICETFSSIQGEGLFTGTPAFFIRFAGCNLDCSFCDEKIKYKDAKDYTEADFYKLIDSIKEEIVILTGGEPMLQLGGTNAVFLQILKLKNKEIHVETNGSGDLPFHLEICDDLVDFWTYSPKTLKDFQFVINNRHIGVDCSEFKLLVPFIDRDLSDWEKEIKQLLNSGCAHNIYLQPITDNNELANFKLCSKVLDDLHGFEHAKRDKVKISLQTHNIYDLR